MKIGTEQAKLLIWGLNLLYYDSRAVEFRLAIQSLKIQLQAELEKKVKKRKGL